MARASVLLFISAAVLRAAAVRPGALRGDSISAFSKPQPRPPSCETLEKEEACLGAAGCTWCTAADDAKSYCFPEAQAKFLPHIFDCKGQVAPGVVGAVPDPSKCSDNLSDEDCDGDPSCTWCTSSFGWDKGSCYVKDQAKFLPKQMFDCHMDDKDAAAAQGQQQQQMEQLADPSPMQCLTIKDRDDCDDEKDCTWCKSTYGPTICYSSMQAKYLPPSVYDCDADGDREQAVQQRDPASEPEPPVGPQCADLKTRNECDDDEELDCTWCKSKYSPAMCYDAAQAKYLPSGIFTCDEDDERSKKVETAPKQDDPEPTPVQCSDFKEQDCEDENSCVWCKSSYGPALCYEDTQAKYLPPSIFDCGAQADDLKSAHLDTNKDDDEDAAAPPMPTQCSQIKDADDCDDEKDCTWCTMAYGPAMGMCYNADQAKYLPPSVYTCDEAPDAKVALEAGERGPKPAPTGPQCADHKDRDECDDDEELDCTWCKSKYSPAMCYDAAQAKYLPSGIFTCDSSDDDDDDDVKTQVHKEEDPAPPMPTQCSAIKDRDNCDDEKECTWCKTSYGPAMCYNADQAKYLPASVYVCDDSDKDSSSSSSDVQPLHAKAAPDCEDIKVDDDCDDADGCTWCKSSFTDTGSCFTETAAKFLPPQMFDCDADDKAKERLALVEELLQADVDCTDLKNDDDCNDEDTCTWCKSSWMEKGSCFAKASAKYLPPSMFECDADEERALRQRLAHTPDCMKIKDEDECDGTTNCTWCVASILGKGSCFTVAAAKILPPSWFECDPIDDDQQLRLKVSVKAPSDNKVDCVKIKDETDCDDLTECTWCVSSYLGKGLCLAKSAAKILPPSMFECDSVESSVQLHKVEAANKQCMDIKDGDDCEDEDGCTWCTSSFMGTGSCFGQSASKFLPSQVFHCGDEADDVQGRDQDGSRGGDGGYGADCEQIKDDDDCDDVKDCTWCTSSFMEKGACFPKAVAKYLPPQMFDCDGELQRQSAVRSNVDCDKLSESQCAPPDCVWCTSAAVGGGCFTPDQAAKLPSAIFDCKSAPS